MLTYLSDGVLALNEGEDTLLLDRRGVLETIAVNATKDTLLKPHIVKLINFQFPVRFENLLRFVHYKHAIRAVETYRLHRPF